MLELPADCWINILKKINNVWAAQRLFTTLSKRIQLDICEDYFRHIEAIGAKYIWQKPKGFIYYWAGGLKHKKIDIPDKQILMKAMLRPNSNEVCGIIGQSGENNKIVFWDIGTKEIIRTLETESDSQNNYLCFHPNGNLLLHRSGRHSYTIYSFVNNIKFSCRKSVISCDPDVDTTCLFHPTKPILYIVTYYTNNYNKFGSRISGVVNYNKANMIKGVFQWYYENSTMDNSNVIMLSLIHSSGCSLPIRRSTCGNYLDCIFEKLPGLIGWSELSRIILTPNSIGKIKKTNINFIMDNDCQNHIVDFIQVGYKIYYICNFGKLYSIDISNPTPTKNVIKSASNSYPPQKLTLQCDNIIFLEDQMLKSYNIETGAIDIIQRFRKRDKICHDLLGIF